MPGGLGSAGFAGSRRSRFPQGCRRWTALSGDSSRGAPVFPPRALLRLRTERGYFQVRESVAAAVVAVRPRSGRALRSPRRSTCLASQSSVAASLAGDGLSVYVFCAQMPQAMSLKAPKEPSAKCHERKLVDSGAKSCPEPPKGAIGRSATRGQPVAPFGGSGLCFGRIHGFRVASLHSTRGI